MKVKLVALPLVAVVLAGGCGGPSSPDAGPPTFTNAASANAGPAGFKPSVDASPALAPEAGNRFIDDLHRKLESCDQKINELGRKLESLNDEARADGAKAIETWRVQRGQLGQKLDEIKKSGREAGQDIKAGCESAVAELEKAFEKLKSRFKD